MTFAVPVDAATYAALRAKCDAGNAAWQRHASYDRSWASSADQTQQAAMEADMAAMGGMPTNDEKTAVEVYEFYHENPPSWLGYLHRSDGVTTVTNWTGAVLVRVTKRSSARYRGFYGVPYTRVFWSGVDAFGRHWYGSGSGDGMFTRMHRAKGAK